MNLVSQEGVGEEKNGFLNRRYAFKSQFRKCDPGIC